MFTSSLLTMKASSCMLAEAELLTRDVAMIPADIAF